MQAQPPSKRQRSATQGEVLPYLSRKREPPHREDIRAVVECYLTCFCRRCNRDMIAFSEREMASLCRYAWPGNIRELRDYIENLVIFNEGDLPQARLHTLSSRGLPARTKAAPDEALFEDLPSMEKLQKRYVLKILRLTKGRMDGDNGAVSILKMNRSTLYAKIRKWGLDAKTQFYG